MKLSITSCLALSIAGAALAAGQQVTFSKDIAPIFERACQNCHRPGSIAPMSLLTYADARPWARSIKQKVATRVMPPWHIDRNVGINKFKDDPSLSDAEIAAIVNWVDQGAPEGNPSDLPRPRQFSDLDQWHIGKPDIVVSMTQPYVLKAKGGDEYFDVDVDPGFTEDVYIQAVETKPDSGFKVVHHCTTNLVEDPEDDPVGLFLNEYAVGKNADIFPQDSGRLIKAGSKIHFNLHLHPDGQETPVKVSLGLKLYPKGFVPKYVAFTQHMGDVADLDLPAGQITRSDGYFRLQRPAVISAYQPHFHLRGKAQCMEAIYPDVRADSARPGPARTETLSCVSDYQFGWSITYNYAEDASPVLPAGTIIHVSTWHDNTDNNKFNPNPKNWVGSGQRTIDEMSFAWVSLYYIDEADYQQRLLARRK
ncbi:MAG: cytochrome c [Bryobacterales bacterium]|nr:cytochrome c [Bryobacterales bacterium]MBV9402063.1 cytochrome c [Bryobacterales bacterium]